MVFDAAAVNSSIKTWRAERNEAGVRLFENAARVVKNPGVYDRAVFYYPDMLPRPRRRLAPQLELWGLTRSAGASSGLASLADLPQQLAASGGIYCELARGGKTETPKSCSDWERLHAAGYEPSTTLEVIAGKGRCLVIKLLRRAQPASRSFVRELKLTPKLVSILPAALLLSREDDSSVLRVVEVR